MDGCLISGLSDSLRRIGSCRTICLHRETWSRSPSLAEFVELCGWEFLCRTSPLDYIDAEGVVYEKRAFFVSVVFERIPLDLTKVEWRLDKGSNKVAYERMHKALKLMCRPEHLLPSWFRSCVVPSALVHLTDEQRSRYKSYFQVKTIIQLL